MINIEEILSVDATEYTRSLGTIREEINKLRQALLTLEEGSEDYEEVAKAIYQRQQEISGVMNASKKYIDAQEGSMNQLLATLRRQKEEWKALGNVEKEDIERKKELTEEINKTKAKINEMNHSIGNWQDNVGNYSNSIQDAFKQMGISFGGTSAKFASFAGILTGGLSKISGAFKSLWAVMVANPIGAVITALGALVGAFSAVSRAIHENEQSEMRLHEAMSAFRPIADKFRNWIDKVAQGFVLFTEALADAWNWLRKVYAAYTDWAGYTEGRKDQIQEEIVWYKKLANAENAIIKERREVQKLNAKDEARVAELRDEAMYAKDAAEKHKMLKEAREAQVTVNERNLKLAQDELKLLQAQAEKTPNSIEVNNKLAAAEAKVDEVRAANARSLRMLDRQIAGYGNSVGKATNKVDEHTKALEREREAMLKAHEQAKKNAEQILKESEEALMTEAEKEAKTYEERKKELEDFNLSTEALDEVHRKKMAELAQKEAEAKKKAAEETMAYEKDLADRRATREGGSFSDWDIEEIINRNNQEFEAEKALAESKIELNEELMGMYEENDARRTELERENARLREDIANADYQREKKNEKAYEKLLDARLSAAKGMGSGISTILKGVSKAFGENTKASKGFAIAAATIDTIGAAVAGFKAGYNQWKDAPGPLAAMAPIQGAINAAAALAAGYAQVQQIRNVDTSGQNTGGGAAMALAIPNIEGLTSPVDYTRQVTTETEKEEMNQNNRVYILESDIQQSNNRVKVREDETTF